MNFGTLIRPVRALTALILFLLPLCSWAQTDPSNFDEIASQASIARERDDVPRAVDLYTQALTIKPGWPEGWWFLGSLQYEAEAYAASRDALTRYIELIPDAAPAWALRGLCEFETGEYTKSLNDIQRGLSLGAAREDTDAKILRYHEALLLTRTGNFEGALQKYRPLARGKVPNPELLIAIGLAGLQTPLLPKELRADRRELYAVAGNAAFLFMSGDEKAAQQAFQELFQRFPTAENSHYFYGYLLSPQDPDLAIRELKRELEITPSNTAAQLLLAWDCLTRNDFGTALTYAKKVAAAEPTLPIAQVLLGRALVETGDVRAGTELLEKELKLQPDNLEIHFALAKAYSKTGRKEDARRERLLCLQREKSATTQEAHR